MEPTDDLHQPVLATEILAAAPAAMRVVDGTLGDGGHAALFLARGATVLGIDRDPTAIARARARLGTERVTYAQGNAYDEALLDRIAEFRPDLILLDLGVSSRQLDDLDLGFTFRENAPLDMRMARSGPTAADLLATASEATIASWLSNYADENRPGRLAAEIVRRRDRAPFRSSDDLVNAIRGALGPRTGPGDFARIFQAFRIAVNDELAGLESALPVLRDALVPGGTLAAISYHSGEDRIVKQAFKLWSKSCTCPPEFPICRCRGRSFGAEVFRRPVSPSDAEIRENPRARSAKLRLFRVADDGGEAR